MKLSQALKRSKMSAAAFEDLEESEDRNTRRTHDLVAKLSPSERYIFGKFEAHSAVMLERFTEARNGLMVVHVTSKDWLSTVAHAARTAVLCAMTSGRSSLSIVADAQASKQLGATVLSDENILAELQSGHVVCVLLPGEAAPAIARELVDVEVRIAELDAVGTTEILASKFADVRDIAIDGAQFTDLHPERIDLAVQRAATSDEAVRLLTVFANISVDEELRRRAAEDAKAVEERRGPSLRDLHGYGAAKDWGMRLAGDLRSFAAGQLDWAEIDTGALFVGPPGTGKTQLAGAIAQDAECAFFPTSYADWQSSRDGHLGSLMKALRKTFEDAAKRTPAIVFIDEIDTLQARGGSGRHDDWWTSIMNALLECLDGTNRREGVVVIAACNDASRLDPALVRSGRLDRRFAIELPDEEALAAILAGYLKEARLSAAIRTVATAMAGSMSGADALRVTREARQAARHAKRAVTSEDLLASAFPCDTRSSELMRRIATHEAGHAVAHMAKGSIPRSLSLLSAGGAGGEVRYDPYFLGTEGRREDFERKIVSTLAGRAAEEVLLGSVSAGSGGSADSDLASATSLVMQMEAKLGLGASLSYVEEIDGRRVESEMQRLYVETLLLVGAHRAAVEELAELALSKRVLGRSALAEFARRFDF